MFSQTHCFVMVPRLDFAEDNFKIAVWLWSVVGCESNVEGCKIFFFIGKSPLDIPYACVCACICVCELGGVFWEPRNLINKLMHK